MVGVHILWIDEKWVNGVLTGMPKNVVVGVMIEHATKNK